MADHWIKLLVLSLVMIIQVVHGSENITITLLESAVSKGAVCLDGSPPAYFYDKGYGEGADNWVVYLEGGGWCANTDFCHEWISTKSTFKREKKMQFRHILAPKQTINPDFYNWNRVFVAYCDGSSFMGDVEEVTPAILSGGSAGGMATIYHCDGFRALIPGATRYKCIADSGIFTPADKKDLIGYEKRVHRFDKLIAFHGTDKLLPKSCTSKMSVNLIYTGLDPGLPYSETTWYGCGNDLDFCTCPQIQSMKEFRAEFLKTLQAIAKSSSIGMFVHSCHIHGHFLNFHGWDPSPLLQNKTIAKVIEIGILIEAFFK
ncbi:UNVERIFIED_CONTAM: Pectin acetylesterase 7 [Sesamum calycinum]|uniref:Pectin acetylesterase n=1 Tax=Sesamum calycinum TaxID=2727403 RepID=A0AAW2QLN8_9LAMI